MVTSSAQIGSAFFPTYAAFENALDDLLGRYVNEEGYVDYQAWSEDTSDMTLINALVETFADFDPADHDAFFDSQDAALSALHQRLQHLCHSRGAAALSGRYHPPDGACLFQSDRFLPNNAYQLGDDNYSLDELENEIIRADFN